MARKYALTAVVTRLSDTVACPSSSDRNGSDAQHLQVVLDVRVTVLVPPVDSVKQSVLHDPGHQQSSAGRVEDVVGVDRSSDVVPSRVEGPHFLDASDIRLPDVVLVEVRDVREVLPHHIRRLVEPLVVAKAAAQHVRR